eukprot:1248788-Pyramimonas_sp.AAC.1
MNQIGKLTVTMFWHGCSKKAKVAEARRMLPLVPALLRESASLFGDKPSFFTAECGSLRCAQDITHQERRHIPPSIAQRMQQAMLRFLPFWKRCGGKCVFKDHVALAQRFPKHGARGIIGATLARAASD